MAKKSKNYICKECGHEHLRWVGKCDRCKEWGSVEEVDIVDTSKHKHNNGWVSSDYKNLIKGKEVSSEVSIERVLTKIPEFDNVFGKGITVGSVNIISGEPGAGKSTILIQAICEVLNNIDSAYVSGEESLQQIRNRAKRLELNDEELFYLSETNVENIINQIESKKLKFVVIDSIQTLYSKDSDSSPGGAAQLKICTQKLTNYAKSKHVTVLIVGHVTKDGSVAGPKQIEHIVDGVFSLEGDSNSRFRLLRTSKNRFGEVNEIGIFAMTEKGMISISNPSSMFLTSENMEAVGSSVVITKEGRRSIMYEIQSLVTNSDLEIPNRLSLGINHQRVKMLLAILQKNTNIKTFKKDIYVSVVGGVQIPISDTSTDLSLAFSIYSSENDIPLSKKICSFGEVSLTGEVRPVPHGEDRIKEAAKHGFEYIFVPKGNANKSLINKYKEIKILGCSNIQEAISKLENISMKKNP